VAAWGSFCRSSKSLCGRCFRIILNRSDGFLDYCFFFTPNFGGGCEGGSFHLWPVKYAPKIIVGGCTSTPISLVQIWVLHLEGFPCKWQVSCTPAFPQLTFTIVDLLYIPLTSKVLRQKWFQLALIVSRAFDAFLGAAIGG